MRTFFMLPALIICAASMAQFQEDFNDGDYNNNPTWTALVSDWQVTGGRLQSRNATTNSVFMITTASTLALNAEWNIHVELDFNTSSSNYVDIYLVASMPIFEAPQNNGYFVRIGNTQDEVSLYRRDGSILTKIIDGMDGITNHGSNALSLRVTRNAALTFRLYRNSGNGMVQEGSVTDGSYTTGSFAGILVRQSTASFFEKHYFDDFTATDYVPDQTPPSILRANAVSAFQLKAVFNEPLSKAAAENNSNYQLSPGNQNPISSILDPNDASTVLLNFAQPFGESIAYTLSMENLEDAEGNISPTLTAHFEFYLPKQGDIVIHEIMADPSPPRLLPEAEYIELRNRSSKAIDLTGWRIIISGNISAAFPSVLLPPDSFFILTSDTNVNKLLNFGNAAGLQPFPSLNNSNAMISLVTPEGKTVHAVNYSSGWYGNPVAAVGGISLEMRDANHWCGESMNWTASSSPSGGTPGKKNASSIINTDEAPPVLLRTYSLDSLTLCAVFSESLDSISSAATGMYSISGNLLITGVEPKPPLFQQVILKLSTPMEKKKVYTVTVSGLKDCAGNLIGHVNSAKAGLAETALQGDAVLNEILFNPRPNAFDFLELFNPSDKILDASQLHLASRNAAGSLIHSRQICPSPHFIFPGEYMVLTEEKASLGKEYLVTFPEAVLELSLPALPDEKGTAVLMNSQGNLIDELSYHEDWHFALVKNPEGVSLERIDPGDSTSASRNWHSAASTAGYGTPGYRNSQYRRVGGSSARFQIEKRICSPDGDGVDDHMILQYNVPAPGYVASIFIFEASGRLIRVLVRNDLLGTKGSWKWDGLGEGSMKLPPGAYVVQAEFFNLEGSREIFREAVFLAVRPR